MNTLKAFVSMVNSKDFDVQIPGSVSPSSLGNMLRDFSTVSIVLFFSTLIDWFSVGFGEIIGSVTPSSLGNGLGALFTVSAALLF